MQYLRSAILFACLGTATLIFANVGVGYEHGKHEQNSHNKNPISESEAIKKAKQKILQLVDKSKIANSWAKTTEISAEQKTYSQGPEWVVTFKNTKIKDKSKQTLYLFYSLDGNYIAANYTGN